MPSQKISVLAIENVRKAMREAPEYSAKEVSKMQAVRLLAPQIQEMQAKGYSLGPIAGMLSDNGFIITVTALKNYLTKVKAEMAKKTPRSSTRMRISDRTLPGTSTRMRVMAVASEGSDRSGATAEMDRGRVGDSNDRGKGPTAVPSAAVVTTSSGGAPLRSGSTPRKDSSDI